MIKYACIALLVAVAVADEVKFKDCGHHEVTKLDLSGCSGDFCTIHKGKEFKLDAEFVANQDTSKVQIHITAKVGLIEIAVPGVEKDACHHMKCPVTKGDKVHFDYALLIPKLVPNIKAHITAKLIGEHGVMACVNVNGEVKN